jgi:hypothetical protein
MLQCSVRNTAAPGQGVHLPNSSFWTVRVAAALLLLMAADCAQGFTAQPDAPPAPPPAGAPAPFLGQACTVGERAACSCPSGGGQGMKVCSPDDTSPTKGSFSACLLCAEAPTPAGNSGAANGGGASSSMSSAGRSGAAGTGIGTVVGAITASAGTGGRAGAAASAANGGASGTSTQPAGTGGSGAAPAGTGGSGSGGTSAGSRAGASGGGTGGATGGRCMCTNTCLLIGIAPCCRANGSCGCTWAPGAYCM